MAPGIQSYAPDLDWWSTDAVSPGLVEPNTFLCFSFSVAWPDDNNENTIRREYLFKNNKYLCLPQYK